MQELISLGAAKLALFSEDQIGTTSDVLFERRNKQGLWEGYSSNFVKVLVDSTHNLSNKIVEIEMKSFKDNRLIKFSN